MTHLHWHTIRQDATERFKGQTPRAEDEAAILEHFTATPQRVQTAINDIADALATGQIRWAWSTLRGRLEKPGAHNVTVDTGPNRAKATTAAEQWVRTAGVHFDRETEVLDELFHRPDALLKPWAKDELLHRRLLDLWAAERPRGQQAETESEAWQTKLRHDRQRTHSRPRTQEPT